MKVAVAGISPDLPPKLKQFPEQHRLGFPLFSDPDHKIAEAYGTWGEKSMSGKKTWGIIRSAFLLDEKGRIAGAWTRISPKDTVPKALAALEGRA